MGKKKALKIRKEKYIKQFKYYNKEQIFCCKFLTWKNKLRKITNSEMKISENDIVCLRDLYHKGKIFNKIF
jgi:hypothetical protein